MFDDADQERRRDLRWEQKRRRLGSLHPACAICFRTDVAGLFKRALEQHHFGRRRASAMTVEVCRFDHAALDDLQYDWPAALREPQTPLHVDGALLRGIADFIRRRTRCDLELLGRAVTPEMVRYRADTDEQIANALQRIAHALAGEPVTGTDEPADAS